MPNSPSQPVIITGMHRSGTSLMGSFLNALGIHLGERLLPPDRTNSGGYFEDVDFLALQSRMLQEATHENDGGHRDWGWTESEQLDRTRFSAYTQVASDLAAARGRQRELWGWKDPRTTLLLDFWHEILASRALYVLVYRFPWEVADSMQRIGAAVFLNNPEYAFRIWAFYNRHLLDFYRRHRDRAVLISSNGLMRESHRFMQLLRGKLGLTVGDAALEDIWQRDLFVSFGSNDPLIRLTLATSPECKPLLTELEAEADLPATGLWKISPVRDNGLRRADSLDLSVVIPCYNHGQVLVDAIASVERTTPDRCELVIVNDGSTQTYTVEVLDTLRQAGYRIIDQPNQGLAAARNAGIRVARGRYILPLDADNRLASGFVADAIHVLDTEPHIGVVYGDRLEFGVRSGRARVPEFNIDRLLWWNFIDACAVYRREIWQACDGYDAGAAIVEDWEFWIAAAKHGWQFRRLPNVTFEYRIRPNSMVMVAEYARLSSSCEYILRKHRALYEEHLAQVFLAGRTQLLEAWRDLANRRESCERLRHEKDLLANLKGNTAAPAHPA